MSKHFVSINVVFLSLFCLSGCSTPNYALKPMPRAACQIERIGRVDYLKTKGSSAEVGVYADIFNFLDKQYLMIVIAFSNTSNAQLEMNYESMDIECKIGGVEKKLTPIEPDTLIASLARERASQESSRNVGTVFLALAAAQADPGTSTDFNKVDQTVNNRNSATKYQSSQASDKIRHLDRFLLRRNTVESGMEGGGIVMFPFVKSDIYKLHARIGDSVYEFDFQLRSY